MTLTNQLPSEVTQYGLYKNWESLVCANRRTEHRVQVRVRDELETPSGAKMLGPLRDGGWLNKHGVGGMVGKELGEAPSGVAASPVFTFMDCRWANGGFKV